MKSKLCPWAIYILLWFVTASIVDAQLTDRVAAVVNGEAITQREINARLYSMQQNFTAGHNQQEWVGRLKEAKPGVLNQLIEDKLILQEAIKKGIEVSEAEVNKRLQAIRSRFPSQEEFEQSLARQGLSFSALKENLKEQIMRAKLVDRQVRLKVLVNPKEVTQYYQEHLAEFKRPEQLEILNILIRVEDISKEQKLKDEAERLLDLLRGGMRLDNLLKISPEYAEIIEVNKMERVGPGELIEEIDSVIFSLNPGEFSKLIRSDLGYHIFKVEAKFPAQTKELFEVQEFIYYKLFWQKAEKRYKEWIRELKNDAYIVIK